MNTPQKHLHEFDISLSILCIQEWISCFVTAKYLQLHGFCSEFRMFILFLFICIEFHFCFYYFQTLPSFSSCISLRLCVYLTKHKNHMLFFHLYLTSRGLNLSLGMRCILMTCFRIANIIIVRTWLHQKFNIHIWGKSAYAEPNRNNATRTHTPKALMHMHIHAHSHSSTVYVCECIESIS